jgi:UDP-glucose 4-epimerase
MELAGKRLLVVGGAGLIGSHTVEALLAEDVAEVRVYDNFTRGSRENLKAALADPRVRIFEHGGDVLHTDVLDAAMKGIDGVFHFAALWLLHCWDYPRAAFDVNIGGTFNVLEACVANGVSRLVYSSSASVNDPNFYGATKVAGEAMCRAFHHRHRAFDWVGLRYMNVYGPRQDHRGAYVAVIMKMLDRLLAGEAPVVHGDGSQAYDFVYVTDCARANVQAMKAATTDAVYDVGVGATTTIRELAELLRELTAVAAPVRHEAAGRTFAERRVADVGPAAKDLGFRAEVGLRQGLERLLEWRRVAS